MEQRRMVILSVIALVVAGYIIYSIVEIKKLRREKEEAGDMAYSLQLQLDAINEEDKRRQDSILAAQAELARMEEQQRKDAAMQTQRLQEKEEHVTFAFSRINEFGNKYMKEVSPASGEALSVVIDTAKGSYDELNQVTIIPFQVTWMAYMYGLFRNEDGKSLHHYEGEYKLMGNYDEYITTIYQNYSLQEGIKSNERASRTFRTLDNVAEILDKVDKIDRALSNKDKD